MASVMSILCFLMTELLKKLNSYIKSILTSSAVVDINSIKEIYKHVIDEYNLILDMHRKFEKCFGISLTILFLSLFLFSQINILYIIIYIKRFNFTWLNTQTYFLSFCLYWLPAILIWYHAYHASELSQESLKLHELILELTYKSVSSSQVDIMYFNSIISRFESLEITLNKIFNLDRSFLPSLIASLVTFTIMLIQLGVDWCLMKSNSYKFSIYYLFLTRYLIYKFEWNF
jgi:hypothetical protein